MPKTLGASKLKKRKSLLGTRSQRDLDTKAKTAKRGELQHVRLSVRPAVGGNAPFIVSYAEADGKGSIKRYDRSEYWNKETALRAAERRRDFSKTPLIIASKF